MYSMIPSSSRYFTDSSRLMNRRASVDDTSLATQLVTMWMFRRYLLRRSELKMNCSGLLPLRVMTTSPCWPRIASSWEKWEKSWKTFLKFILTTHIIDIPQIWSRKRLKQICTTKQFDLNWILQLLYRIWQPAGKISCVDTIQIADYRVKVVLMML